MAETQVKVRTLMWVGKNPPGSEIIMDMKTAERLKNLPDPAVELITKEKSQQAPPTPPPPVNPPTTPPAGGNKGGDK